MVKKFKNGNVLVGYDSKYEMYLADINALYEGDFFWNDLYIHYVSEDDSYYLIDCNRSLIYSLEWCRRFHPNILGAIHGAIVHENNRLRLHPVKDTEEYERVMADWRAE